MAIHQTRLTYPNGQICTSQPLQIKDSKLRSMQFESKREHLLSGVDILNRLWRGRMDAFCEQMKQSFHNDSFPLLFDKTYLEKVKDTTPTIQDLMYNYAVGCHKTRMRQATNEPSKTALYLCRYLAIVAPEHYIILAEQLNGSGHYQDQESRKLLDTAALGYQETLDFHQANPEYLHYLDLKSQRHVQQKMAENQSLQAVNRPSSSQVKLHLSLQELQQRFTEDECKQAVCDYCKDDKCKQNVIQLDLRDSLSQKFDSGIYDNTGLNEVFKHYEAWVETWDVGWYEVCAALQAQDTDFRVQDFISASAQTKNSSSTAGDAQQTPHQIEAMVEKGSGSAQVETKAQVTMNAEAETVNMTKPKPLSRTIRTSSSIAEPTMTSAQQKSQNSDKTEAEYKQKVIDFCKDTELMKKAMGMTFGSQKFVIEPNIATDIDITVEIQFEMFQQWLASSVNVGNCWQQIHTELKIKSAVHPNNDTPPAAVVKPIPKPRKPRTSRSSTALPAAEPQQVREYTDKEYAKVIDDNWYKIQQSLNVPQLLSYLSSQGFFGNAIGFQGLNQVASHDEKVNRLYAIMQSESSYKLFYQAVKAENDHSGHPHIVKIIDEQLKELRKV